MHVHKALVNLVAASDHTPYDFLELALGYGAFLFSVSRLLLRTGLVNIDHNPTHPSCEYHLIRREKSRNGSHLEADTVEEPFQVELFVDLNLSFFEEKSVASAGLATVGKAH